MSDEIEHESGGTGPAEDDRFEQRIGQITEAVERLARSQETIVSEQKALASQTEQQQLQSRIAAYGQQLAQGLARSESNITAAEAALAQAHEDGDGATVAQAQRKLSEAVAARAEAQRKLDEHKAAKADFERRQRTATASPSQRRAEDEPAKVDTKNRDDWINKNSSWYGVDAELTKAAHEINDQIRRAGVIPVGSTAYFNAIDRQMSQRFPDRFKRSPDTASGSGGSGGHASNGGARGGRLPESVVSGWRRMGINVDDPKTLERMVGHQQKLRDKGILPPDPSYGRIVT